MRDPKRLCDAYDEILHLHMTYMPDIRIGQFWCNFVQWFNRVYRRDIFYVEDSEILKYMKVFVGEEE